MFRFVAVIVVLLVSLQFAWVAAGALYGHAGENVSLIGVHSHEHGHDHGHGHGHADRDAPGESRQDGGDRAHCEHCHLVLSAVVVESGLTISSSLPGGPILQPPVAYLSHTPALLDRPPLARA